ncbi:unnamed protein product [Protopolystoma xenopodis]|uniref:Uncharacterized protein n=1 Tax=Protopolystoma xenopodis TaxID=117903 RepID=A0A3S5ACZ1_9PLAT|nr:unnamed protein product [Protopolystoma xenopodis]
MYHGDDVEDGHSLLTTEDGDCYFWDTGSGEAGDLACPVGGMNFAGGQIVGRCKSRERGSVSGIQPQPNCNSAAERTASRTEDMDAFI